MTPSFPIERIAGLTRGNWEDAQRVVAIKVPGGHFGAEKGHFAWRGQRRRTTGNTLSRNCAASFPAKSLSFLSPATLAISSHSNSNAD